GRTVTVRRRSRGELQTEDREPLLLPSGSGSLGLLLPPNADLRLRDRTRRRLQLPDERGRLAAAEDAERNGRPARRADAPSCSQRHAPDPAGRVAAVSARGRLRRAVEYRRNTPRGPPLRGRGARSVLRRR